MTDFIELYIQYQNLRSSTSKLFGKHLCVQLLGHSMGRKSKCVIQPRAIHLNTNVCLLGLSGRSLKTTAQMDILEPLIPKNHKGPSSFSPEGLLRELQDQPHLICPLGEFSTTLRSVKNGGNMVRFKEICNELFTCPDVYTKRLSDKSNSYKIEYPYLSLSTTCTEEEFFPNLGEDVVYGGFLPRWILVIGNENRRPRDDLPDNIDIIENMFKVIFEKAYSYFSRNPIIFRLDDDARNYYNNLCSKLENNEEYQDIQAFVRRYENYIISYACILIVSEIIGKNMEKLFEITELTNITNITIITDITDKIIREGIGCIIGIKGITVTTVDIEKAWKLLEPSLKYTKKVEKTVGQDAYVVKIDRVLNTVEYRIRKNDLLIRSKLLLEQFNKGMEVILRREEWKLLEIIKGEGKHKGKTIWVEKVKSNK